MKKRNPIIVVTIQGIRIPTRLDEHGVQRLPTSPLDSLIEAGVLSLNDLAVAVQEGKLTKDDARYVYQNIGYSVTGYADIFPDDEIINPLWK